MRKRRLFLTGLYLIAVCSSFSISASALIVDPKIPDGEIAEYRLFVNKDEYRVREVTKRIIDNGNEVYRVEAHSSLETIHTKLIKSTMFAYSLQIIGNVNNASVDSRTDLVLDKNIYDSDEVGIIEFHNLPYLLRGMVPQRNAVLRIRLLSDATPFPMAAKYICEESIVACGKTYICNKIQFGLTGILRPFFPPAYFWYSKDAPHYLVRFEGLSSGPGSPKRILELKSRSIAKE
jgi:hypothetical protein